MEKIAFTTLGTYLLLNNVLSPSLKFLFCILNIVNMNRKWLLNYEVHLLLKITDLSIDASICFKLLNIVFQGIMYASSFRVGGMDVTPK